MAGSQAAIMPIVPTGGSPGRYSIVAIGSPALIEAPTSTASEETLPALWAVISFSIFIASMTTDQGALLDLVALGDLDLEDAALQRRDDVVAGRGRCRRLPCARASAGASPRRRGGAVAPPSASPITLTG